MQHIGHRQAKKSQLARLPTPTRQCDRAAGGWWDGIATAARRSHRLGQGFPTASSGRRHSELKFLNAEISLQISLICRERNKRRILHRTTRKGKRTKLQGRSRPIRWPQAHGLKAKELKKGRTLSFAFGIGVKLCGGEMIGRGRGSVRGSEMGDGVVFSRRWFYQCRLRPCFYLSIYLAVAQARQI